MNEDVLRYPCLSPDIRYLLAALPQALPLPAQCLFLRLFQRKGQLFALRALAYREVPDAEAAAGQLQEAGLAAIAAPDAGGAMADGSRDGSSKGSGIVGEGVELALSWHDLAELLTVPELAALVAARRIAIATTAPGPGPPAGGRYSRSNPAGGGGNGNGVTAAAAGQPPRGRQQLLAALAAHAAGGRRAAAQLASWLLEATGKLVRLADGACEAMCRLQRLFFLNEGQSLSQVRLMH
jgi:Fanconi-associated nuclease 1